MNKNKHENTDSIRNANRLFNLANWRAPTINTFEAYLNKYNSLPSYKKVLNSMIKFEEMYQPISAGPRSPQAAMNIFTGYLDKINEQRKLKRAQTYMHRKDLVNTFDSIYGKRIVVTSKGHKIFYEDYPLAQLRKKKWDGEWIIIMYDFPEKIRKQRKYIRSKLIDYGFGSPQISILISPLPLSDAAQKLIEGEKMRKHIWVLKAKNVLGMENREVARKSWPIDELNDLYKKLLEVLPKMKKTKNKELETQWKQYFLSINSKDPYLPFELLPKDWAGEKCEEEFIKLGPFGLLKIFFRKLL